MAKGPSFLIFLCGLWLGANAQCCGEMGSCPSCPSGWTGFEDHCYMYYASPKEWSDAETTCLREGGNLVSFSNQEEYDFILKLIRRSSGGNTRIWAGAQDATKNGVWLWSNGSKMTFKKWGPRQPDNARGREHCMELNWNGQPNDHVCNIKKPFMCKTDKE
ncbi:galactose-specific lectin nattectin-like [Neosynchiropus ocellatus]